MKTLLLIARRFIFNSPERSVRTMVKITAIGIALGSCSLALVAAIMSGFEKETRATIQGIHPDLIITAHSKKLNYEKIKPILMHEFGTYIVGVSPSLYEHAMIKLPGSQDITELVTWAGIDPKSESAISTLDKKTKTYLSKSFEDSLRGESILIGKTLADNLGVQQGDTIVAVFTPETPASTHNMVFEQQRLRVGGIFKTGVDEIDQHVVFGSLSLLQQLFPQTGITHIGIKLNAHQGASEEVIIEKLKNRFNLTVIGWKDLYPALLSALTLEKYSFSLILALIILVASMNIISLLFMFMIHKKMEIAILRTLGFTQKEITRLFVFGGVVLALISGSIGVGIAIVLSFLLQHYHLIPLPDIYYVSHVPAHMTISIVVGVLILVFIVSLIAALIPARHIGRLEMASVLKQTL